MLRTLLDLALKLSHPGNSLRPRPLIICLATIIHILVFPSVASCHFCPDFIDGETMTERGHRVKKKGVVSGLKSGSVSFILSALNKFLEVVKRSVDGTNINMLVVL